MILSKIYRLVTICFLMGAYTAFGQTITIPSDSVRGPICVITDSVTKIALPLSPKKSVFNVIITDGLAQLSLTQMFINDYGRIKDMVYVFPLPHQAAVHAMAMEHRGKLYKAEIVEKQEAQAKYDSVVQKGGVAALLLQDRPNVFQQRLANIAFGDTAFVQIKLTMPLKYADDTYELAIPTMVAERYQSSNASSVMSSGRLWNPPPDVEGQVLQVNVLLQTGFSIVNLQSPTHPLVISQAASIRQELVTRKVIEQSTVIGLDDAQGAVLQQATTYPNKDFVLRFSRAAAKMDFSLASFYDTSMNKGYVYANLFPDTALFTGDRAKLDIVLLVDVSGSQSGWPLSKEKEVAGGILDKLNPDDRLSVLSFNDGVNWCFNGSNSVPATGENIAAARKFVNNLVAGGGTNLLAGVESALNVSSGEGYRRFFIFLTDGFITNESAIITAIKTHPTSPTIFTFGAGDNLNRYFLDESAKVGKGISTELTQSEAVAPIVSNVWNKIESPQLQNVTITCSDFEEGSILFPAGTNLYKGLPVTIFAKYKAGGSQTITITGSRNGEKVTIGRDVPLAVVPNGNSMIPQVWAKNAISQLRVEEGTGTSNKTKIIELSKQYQVLSDYTAFLALNPVEVKADQSMGYGMVKAMERIVRVAGNVDLTVRYVNGQLTIELPEGDLLEGVTVYDLSGRCLYSATLKGINRYSRFVWDGVLGNHRKLARGQYLVKIRTTQGIFTRCVHIK